MDTDNTTIEEVMAAIAVGDHAFVITLIERFGHRVQWVVRHHLRDMGRHDLLADTDEVRGLTLDACFAIADRAGAWRAGGALPWVWADLAIRAVVHSGAGHRCVELDADRFDRPEPERPVVTERPYQTLVAIDLRMQAFDQALRQVASARDYGVFVEHLVQQELGDPSPAHSVAELFELSPANVRQIVCRTRRRLDAERVAA